MALKDLFVRELEGPFNFVANRETGSWVLTEETDLSKLRDLANPKPAPPKEFNGTAMVLLNVGRACNLDCIYCHVDLEKTSEKMPSEIGRKAIDRVVELKKEDQSVIFHGSEPLANYELIRELVAYGQSKGITRFGMQTNGTLLDDEKLRFFAENNVGVGISLDGLERHQDFTRPFRRGRSSYEIVIKNIARVIEVLGGVSVITVVSNNNVCDLEEIARDFEERGISSVRFSPLYPTHKDPDYSPDLDILTSQMRRVCDIYLRGLFAGRNPIKVSNFQEMLRTIFAPKETPNCVKCSGGFRQPLMGVDIDGEIYPCDFFWNREGYRVGNVESDSIQEGIESRVNFRNYREFGSLEGCAPCDWKTFCGSGCPGSSVMAGEGILARDPYCEYTKAMLEYTVAKIPELHEGGLIQRVLNDHQR